MVNNFEEKEGFIGTNLPRKVTRMATEDKGLLDAPGKMYVGTGKVESFELDGINYNIPQTIATTELPSTNGVLDAGTYVLQCEVDGNGKPTYSWVPMS